MYQRTMFITPRKKFGRESSSKVRKMLGCLKCKYQGMSDEWGMGMNGDEWGLNFTHSSEWDEWG